MALAGGLQLPKDFGHQHGPAQPHRQLCPKPAQRQCGAAQPQHPGELARRPSALPPLWGFWGFLTVQPNTVSPETRDDLDTKATKPSRTSLPKDILRKSRGLSQLNTGQEQRTRRYLVLPALVSVVAHQWHPVIGQKSDGDAVNSVNVSHERLVQMKIVTPATVGGAYEDFLQ